MLYKFTIWSVATPLLALGMALPAGADTETFGGLPAGTVIGGALPWGGFTDGFGLFPGIRVKSVTNNDGPHTAILFDSSNPSVADDFDLGTPNASCGGPGIGSGGQVGAPGQNCLPYHNLVIIAEDLEDKNSDNIVDYPDDDGDGGTLEFEFARPVSSVRVVLVDVDSETVYAQITNKDGSIRVHAVDLGDNSVQTLQLAGIGTFRQLEVVLSGSGAVAEIGYGLGPVSVEENSWGAVKARYR